MTKKLKLAIALAVLLTGTSAQAKPKPFYKRWQTYVAVGAIVTAQAFNAHETCTHFGVEPRIGQGCATAWGVTMSAAAVEIGLYGVSQGYGKGEDWKPGIIARDWTVPVVSTSLAGYAAWHDSQRPIRINFPVVHDPVR